jgi:hypothetical protein
MSDHDTPENSLARLAESPAATPTEAELLRLLADALGSLRELRRELDELRKQLADMKALTVRKHLLFAAADAERDPASPLQ